MRHTDDLQQSFPLPFKGPYYQTGNNFISLIFIYHMCYLTLLLRASVEPRLGKAMNWCRCLVTNDLPTDYMYHFIDLCDAYPNYRCRQRIVTSIYRYLSNLGMETRSFKISDETTCEIIARRRHRFQQFLSLLKGPGRHSSFRELAIEAG